MATMKEQAEALCGTLDFGEDKYIGVPQQTIKYSGGKGLVIDNLWIKVAYKTEKEMFSKRGYYLFVTPCERTYYGKYWEPCFMQVVRLFEAQRNTERQRQVAIGKALSVLPQVLDGMASAYGLHD